jgi:two-component system, OmpR family, sensor kinase
MKFFTRISSRLWITYVLLVVFVLLVAFSGIVIAFRNSPLLYWNEFVRLNYVTNSLANRLDFLVEKNWEEMIHLFLEKAELLDVRVLIFKDDGVLKFDSMAESYASFPMIPDPETSFKRTEGNIRLFQDNDRDYWFYQINPINDSLYLISAVPRPQLQISAIFQDELLNPLFRAGIIAMLVAFVVSWFVARWITRPLKNISESASKLASGDFPPIPLEGPLEVQRLAGVINQMDRQVRDTLQSQKDFVANVSHEFKTPLTSIQGFAQAIHDGTLDSRDGTLNAAHVILEETDRLNYMVNDLLILAKLDAGMITMDMQPLSLNSILEKIVERFSFQISDKDLDVEVDLTHPNMITADGERIVQVFNNLIDNAIKFSPAKSRIIISDRYDEKYAFISVKDEGPGITPEESKRIFDRFYQVDKSRGKQFSRGVGLGLSIAYQIIKAHGGDIRVQSDVGQGACFMVKLPLTHARTK